LDIRDKVVATAHFKALSRIPHERAVENEEKLRIIVVPANKRIGHLVFRVRCVTG
jgi:hypothetical protein